MRLLVASLFHSSHPCSDARTSQAPKNRPAARKGTDGSCCSRWQCSTVSGDKAVIAEANPDSASMNAEPSRLRVRLFQARLSWIADKQQLRAAVRIEYGSTHNQFFAVLGIEQAPVCWL